METTIQMSRFLLISFLTVLWLETLLAVNTGDPCTPTDVCTGKNAVCEDPDNDGTTTCECPDGFTITGQSGNDCAECNNAQDCADLGYGLKVNVKCVEKACACEDGYINSPPNKECGPVECADLTADTNGGITYDPAGTPHTADTVATYECDSSYTLVGTPTRTCTNTAEWSGTAPVCTYDCGQTLSDPTNGVVVYGADTLAGSEATYQCDNNYLLSGIDTSICVPETGWSGTPPVCNLIVNGAWGNWAEWGSCSLTCGDGTQTRSRLCDSPAEANGGADCVGDSSESVPCNVGACPVNGAWSDWAEWGSCSVTCGDGTQTRSRLCDNPAEANGGADCVGDSSESVPCNVGACPVNGAWGNWAEWGSCSLTCGGGTQTRSRLCDSPAEANGGADCVGDSSESVTCNVGACPVDGGFSNWGEWSSCPVTCGTSIATRTRECDNPTPQHEGAECVGDTSENQSCDSGTNCVVPVDGGFSNWGEWSSCPVTCGTSIATRTRECDNPTPQHEGAECVGDTSENQSCDSGTNCVVPVDGGFSNWGEWSSCPVTCGTSIATRTRECDNPTPQHEGAECVGDTSENQSCDSGTNCVVPVDGGFSNWGEWSSCPVTCGTSIATRTRECDNPTPQHEGAECVGDTSENQSCDSGTNCVVPVDGGFSNWGEWSSCPVTCGTSIATRTRECDNPTPQHEGAECVGDTSENQSCDSGTNCVVPVDGGFSNWGEWSSCPVTCGTSIATRTRECDNPTPQHEGAECVGDTSENQSCDSGTNCVVPVDGGFSNWGEWSSCPVTCGTSIATRTRECDNPTPQHEGAECVGDTSENQSCDSGTNCVVPVDGGFSNWGEWSSCPVTCGTSIATRTRECDNPTPQHEGAECVGDTSENQSCDSGTNCVVPVDGGFSNWGEWSSCPVTCGTSIATRTRECDNPTPQHEGAECVGDTSENQSCDSGTNCVVPVNGGFSVWSEWGSCSVTCGTGTKDRSRLCNNPPPQNNGNPCDGATSDQIQCIEGDCPIDGGFTIWSEWGSCSVTCGAGTKDRSRLCNNPPPQNGGNACDGITSESMGCNNGNCPINGVWSAWEDWTSCSLACGSGTQNRSRSCDDPPPSDGGTDCDGLDVEMQACNTGACPGIGDECSTEPDLCLGDYVLCDSQTLTCGCDDGYITSNGQCLPVHGSACSTVTDLCHGNYISCKAESLICDCDNGYIEFNGQCYPELGARCDEPPYLCYVENALCNITSRVCVCGSGYIKIDGLCRPDYGTGCSTANDLCYGNYVSCNAESSTCDCEDGYLESNGQCYPELNVSCEAPPYICNDEHASCDSTSTVCVCDSGFIDIDGLCRPVYGTECSPETDLCYGDHVYCKTQSSTCDCDDEYIESDGQCLLDCGQEPIVDYGVIILYTGITTVGGSRRYACQTDYIMIGSPTIECLSTGSWTDPPACKADIGWACQQNDDCIDANTVCTNSCTCADGYLHTSASQIRGSCQAGIGTTCQTDDDCYNDLLCGTDGTCECPDGYLETDGHCVAACSSIISINNGSVNGLDVDPVIGSTVTFICDEGYYLVGDSVLRCTDEQQWSNELPTCYRLCEVYGNFPHGDVTVLHDPPYSGTIASFECDDGYTLTGSSVTACVDTGEWDSEAPSCIRDCKVLTGISNGIILTSNGNSYKSIATYVCDAFTTLSGNGRRECMDNSQWSGEEPICIQDCPSLSRELSYGNVRTSNGYKFESIATYRCSYGYILVGDETRTCQGDSAWSGSVPICVPGCSLVASFDHGGVNTTDNGLTQTFYCDDGYRLVGPAVLECVNGVWDGSQPQCLKVCGNIGVANAQQTPANAHAGQTVYIMCDNGYRLIGENTVVCTSTGTYSPSLPSCARECESLEAPGNGFVNSNGNYAGQTAMFSCKPGFVLGGNTSNRCNNDGRWANDIPTCISNSANLPEQFTACPSIIFTIDPFNETFTRSEIIEAIERGLLDGESQVANVSIANYIIQKMPDGTYRVQVTFDCQLFDDSKITYMGIPFLFRDNSRYLTVTNQPLYIDGTAEFSYGLQDNAPINTTCFWFQHRENCVSKGMCAMDENRQKCLCEETPCEPKSVTTFIVLPSVCVFLMTLLCAGGCYTHPCVERRRKVDLEKRRETESVSTYYDILPLPRYEVSAIRPSMETIHEIDDHEVCFEIVEEEVIKPERELADVRF